MLKQGQILNNRYQIQNTLGEGGFGAVYKVWDDNLQRYCAIKENLQASDESQKQFKREAIMLASLNHPHLVRVTDYFIIQNHGQYLVMDYVEGDSLETILTNNKGPLPSEQSLIWIRQVCDALIYIHGQNPPIIHRDIKPANIRITPQGSAILVDFGLAKTFDIGAKTTMGARGLTPHFAAPEQYGSGGTDAQSDIYSLGVTLYCMLTYSVPPDSVEIMVGNSNPPAPAKVINPNIPNSISNALEHAMQIRRTERYKSVSDFKNALEGEQNKSTQVTAAHMDIDPHVVSALTGKGNSLDSLGRYEEAIRYYDKALEIDPRDVAALGNKGNSLDSLGRYEEAIRYYDKVLEIDPRNVAALGNKSEILASLGRYEEAIRYYDKVLEIDPRDVAVLNNKGASLNHLRRYEESIRYCDMTLEIDSGNTSALINKANALDYLGRYEEAIRYYDKGLEIDPRDVIALNNKGESLNHLGRYEEAIRYYDKALEIDPRNVYALNNKSNTLGSLGRYEDALHYFEKTLKIDPHHVLAMYNKSICLSMLGRYEDAISCFSQTLEIDPRHVLAMYSKGVCLGSLGRYEEALHCYDQTLKIDPRNVPALYNQAHSFDNLGRKREAAQSYKQFLALAPAQEEVKFIEHARQRLRELNGE